MEEVIKETSLTEKEINSIKEKYKEYGKDEIFAIPITVWATPTPYSPIRYDPRRRIMYVPNKKKLVTNIRDLIMKVLGPTPFTNGLFPLYSEVILKSALYIPTPKNFSRENRYIAEAKVLRPVVTPDTDNVEKILNDAIKSFIIFDDAQITSDITEKYYSLYPRMELVIYYNQRIPGKVHEELIKHRKERWQQMWKNEETPVQLHLRRYFNTLKKRT